MPPDDTTILGTAHIQAARQGNFFQRATGRGATSNVSASLKFDIPGLKEFKGQLDAIDKSLATLNTTFTKLAKAPEAFSKSVEGVVKQMKALQAAQVQGNRYVTTGTSPQRDPVGQATAAAQGAGANIGTSGGGGKGGGAAAGLGDFFQKAAEAMMKRFDANMQQAIASDVYVSRMAAYSGGGSPTTPAGIFRQQGRQGFGFMGTDMTQANQVLYQGTGIGAYYGAQGRPGQWAQAYQTSIKQMQEVMPGMDATQGAAAQTAIYGNIQGIKLGKALLGVSPYGANGERKTQADYFKDILNSLQRQPRADGSVGAWSKEDLMKQNFPGSRLNAWLSSVLPADAIPMWYEWAILNAASGGNLSNDPNQIKGQRAAKFGRSLALNAQETTNREAQREATFTGEQYGSMNARLDYEKQMVGILQSIDSGLKPFYALLGRVPSMLQGPVSSLIGGVGTALSTVLGGFFGDPGYMPMGDPESSLSHLTPDLRGRVGKMLAANPNIKISSAYRDNKRQQDLQGKGPFAPSGKSKHGRGQAIDLGPSSQLGWIAKNARKFGLDSATGYGEPWHVQLAGTLTMGDPVAPTVSDPSGAARATEAALTKSVVDRVKAALTSTSTTTTSTTDSGSIGSASTTNFTPDDKGKLSADQMVQLLHNAGFVGEDIVKMAGISYRESGGWKPGAYNPNASTGDNSLGLWQINVLGNLGPARLKMVQAAGGSSLDDLYKPEIAAKVAYQMWSQSGYYPWGPYKGMSELNNVPQSALDEARQAAEAHGYLGDVGYATGNDNGAASSAAKQAAQALTPSGSTSTTMVGGSSVVFNNSFQLAFPSGASRQSIDVATRQIASRLEAQMRSVVPRNN